MLEFLFILTLIWLVIASISDLRKREVPNWLSFSLIVFALAFRAFYSVFYSDAGFFVYGVAGFLLFLGLSYVFYYARVFAGGDAKLLMGLGAVLPFASSFYANLFIIVSFIFFLLFAGSVYGLLYSFVMVGLNKKNFVKEFKKQFKMRKMLVVLGLVLALLSLIFVFYLGDSLLFLLPLIIFAFPVLLIYARAVEESCMIKIMESKEVTVGDWLYQEVSVGRKKIKPYWEGLSEEEVKLLRKFRGKVKIKVGIPFVPVFLIAFILLLFLWYSSWSFFNLFF